MEVLGRLNWFEKQGVVIYLRAVTPVMVLSYCTAVHKWLNIDDLFSVCVCMRFFFFYFYIPPLFTLELIVKKQLLTGLQKCSLYCNPKEPKSL